jgi:hypothetical protein
MIGPNIDSFEEQDKNYDISLFNPKNDKEKINETVSAYFPFMKSNLEDDESFFCKNPQQELDLNIKPKIQAEYLFGENNDKKTKPNTTTFNKEKTEDIGIKLEIPEDTHIFIFNFDDNSDEEKEKEKEEQSHESDKNISNEDEFKKDEIELNNQSSGTNKNISKDSNIDFTNHKNFQNIKILYKYKLKNLRNIDFLKIQYENFWKLVPHNFEGEITKKDFLNLFTKIYKLLLPIFNYEEIEKFLLGEWALQTKGKSTMDHEIFNKCIFKISHLFCVHIEKNEYEDFLKMIYKRITKKIKYFPDKTKVEYKPSIKVHLYKEITKEEYDEKTWEQ